MRGIAMTNMSAELYDMIFNRKSFHMFTGVGGERITPEEMDAIRTAFAGFERLYADIGMAIRIVPAERILLKRDAEYCILLYSEKKENYLMNAGYVGEQLDLWLVQHHIGSLWYGLGKPDEATCDGKDFVIMMAIRKVSDDTKYRKDLFKAKRKPLAEIWSGDSLGAAEIARFAPSACNSQPWYVENREGTLTVYRIRKPGKIGIMSASSARYFNRIDVGIFLCVLELCLEKNGLAWKRALLPDDGGEAERTEVAVYKIDTELTGSVI